MPTNMSSSMASMLKELYNPDPPWYIIAHRERKLTELDKLLYADEIKEYTDSFSLLYVENPLLKLIK